MFALSAHRQAQPKTFANQALLPRLPIPELEQSLRGYLESLRPVLEQKYGEANAAKELEKRRVIVNDFQQPGGLGPTLSERLKDLDNASPNNWLNDTLWLPLAYHTWRAPLLINSNWWLLFKDDPNAPTPTENDCAPLSDVALPRGKPDRSRRTIQRTKVKKEQVTPWQIRRSAWLVSRFLEFKGKLDREEIAPDASRAGPFDMHQYTRMYGLTRIPRWECDTFNVPDKNAKHITVLINDHVYSVDVLDPQGNAISPAEIESKLWQVVEDAQQAGEAVRVGTLSADERDTWTKNRERLLALKNRPVLTNIETSIFALSLDTHTLPAQATEDPLIRPSLDAHVQNCASGLAGRNRWFDKALSVIVETNGRAGMMGEHSPCDALIPSVIVDYVVAEPVVDAAFSPVQSSGGWKRLEWKVDQELETEIKQCEERNWKIIEDSDASQLWWSEYGADWIKKTAKQSPDAYLQMALQLAWYKNQGYFSATYETASTRSFLHGRTDVIRTLSNDSVAFVKAMLDDSSTDADRYVALSKATASHNASTRQSSLGQGFDRHLMGLRTQLRPGESHPLFDDEAYAKSQEWKLSTSGLSAGLRFKGTGFGTVWSDGYGINYLAGPNLVKFGIESKYSCEVTSTAQFKHHIAESLREMRRVCEAALKAKL